MKWRDTEESKEIEKKRKAIKTWVRFYVPLIYFVGAGLLTAYALTNFPESIDSGRLGGAVTCFGVGVLFIHFE